MEVEVEVEVEVGVEVGVGVSWFECYFEAKQVSVVTVWFSQPCFSRIGSRIGIIPHT